MAASATSAAAATALHSPRRSLTRDRSRHSHLGTSRKAFRFITPPSDASRKEESGRGLCCPRASFSSSHHHQSVQSSGTTDPLRGQALREHSNAGRSARTFDPLRAFGGGGGGGGSSGDGFDKVQQLLGQALGEDRKVGFGPPPPKDREGGSGFVNLVGIEDLLAGQRDFNVAASASASTSNDAQQSDTEQRAPTANDGVSESEALSAGGKIPALNKVGNGQGSSPQQPNTTTSTSGTPAVVPAQQQAAVKVPVKPLPEVKPEQKVIASGILALTLVAFARGSEEILPGSVIEFLQAWMLLAWSGHFLLGCVAAWLATRQGWPGPYWFLKVLFCGAAAFERDLWEDTLNETLGRFGKGKP